MKHPPNIIVQLVHIQGPLKGEIQERSEPLISIGRHPSCHIRFPADLTIMSRNHADIVREGNRFKVVDRGSKNGTFVNGKRVTEAYLKDGDVLTFADVEGGPKVSFLTQIKEESPEAVILSRPAEVPSQPPSEPEPPGIADQESLPLQPKAQRGGDIVVEKMQAPVTVQYGPTLRTFKEVPVTIGKNVNCDFVLDHPSVFDRHAQIFCHESQYWVKDLTGKGMVSVNRQPINLQTSLGTNDELALSAQGPVFRFLGGGRLAEVVTSAEDTPPESSTPEDVKEEPRKAPSEGEVLEKPLSKLKKFFRH